MNFLDEYIKYHKGVTDASEKYAQVLSIVALGHSLGRSSHILLTPSKVFTNFYVLVIGDSTVSRKSTSIIDVLKPIMREEDVLPNHYSPESLYDNYALNPHRILVEGEFSKIFKKAARKGGYMSHIVEDFEDLYGCPDTFKSDTRGKHEVIARNIFISIVGASTPEAVEQNITFEMLEGGMYPRFLIVWEKNPNPQPRRDMPEWLETKKFELETFLKKVRCSRFIFNFLPKNALFTWQQNQMRRERDNSSIIGRYEAYVIKISAVYALNEYLEQTGFVAEVDGLADLDGHINNVTKHLKEDTPYNIIPQIPIDIKHEHFQKAVELINIILTDAIELKNRVSEEKIISKMQKAMRGQDLLPYSDFLRRSHLTAKDFKEGVKTLIDMRKLCELPQTEGGVSVMTYCVATTEKCANCRMSNQSSEVMHRTDA
jgi:hypothetical protein